MIAGVGDVDIRMQRIVANLVSHPGLTVADMAQRYNLSNRQVEYTLAKLNQLFCQNRVAPITQNRRTGLFLSEEQIQALEKEQRKEKKLCAALDAPYRTVLILIFIASSAEFVSLQHIMQLLRISKNTAVADLKRAEAFAVEFHIKIPYSRAGGYRLQGEEWKKRSLMLKCISLFSEWVNFEQIYGYLLNILGVNADFKEFLSVSLDRVYQRHIQFIEKRLNEILLYIFLLWQTSTEEADTLAPYAAQLSDPDRDCLAIAAVLVRWFSRPIPESEMRYLALLLQSIKIESLLSYESPLDKVLKKIVEDMVDRFERISCITVSDKASITDNLFLHLKPVYYRLHYDIPIVNPLLSQMKEEYHEFFEIVRILLSPLEEFVQKRVPEDEIGYITMYFGLVSVGEINIRNITRKNALILCPGGIGTSALIEKQLNDIFPELHFIRASSMSALDSADKYDVLFSTAELPPGFRCRAPVFIIPVMLSNTQKYRLINQVYDQVFGLERKDTDICAMLDLIAQYADIRDAEGLRQQLKKRVLFVSEIKGAHKGDGGKVLQDLLTEETVQFAQSADTWEHAIALAMYPLLKNGSITQRYIDAIIETVKTVGPYIVIAPNICIPHANPTQGVNRLGMTFLKLEDAVKINGLDDRQAKLFFGLAATDSQSHLKALSQLSRLLMDPPTLNAVLQAGSPGEFLNILDSAVPVYETN